MSTLHQENTGGLRQTRWAHWPRRTDCPYYQMFYGAMRVHGVVPVVDLEPTVEWLDGGSADVIHVHWPEGLWRHHRRGLAARVRGVVAVTRFLRAARARGVRVVWTVHNLGAHEGGDWVDAQGYRVVARYSDLIICHTRSSIEETIRRYRPAGSVVLMPLGNYDGVYPEPRPRQDVLAQLGLDPGRPVLSCLGYLRAYKGLELACKAVSRLGDTVQLVVAGPPYKTYDLRPLRRAVDALPYARLLERRLTDQEFADLTAASDAALLPYSKVTTSAVLMAAWSLGTGAIVSDLPFFRELTEGAGDAAMLFRANDPKSLADAIFQYVSIPRSARQAAARHEARKFGWSSCVMPVADWIQQRHQGTVRSTGPCTVAQA